MMFFFHLKMLQKYKFPFVIKHFTNIDSYEELGSEFDLCNNYVFYFENDFIFHFNDTQLNKSNKRQIINFFLKNNIASPYKDFHLCIDKTSINLQIRLLIKFEMIDSEDDLFKLNSDLSINKSEYKWTFEQINEILNWCSCDVKDIFTELLSYYSNINLIFTEKF